jgi:very-short-patch-repair endonuclease
MHHHFHDRYTQRRRALLERRAAGMRASGTASEVRLWKALVNSKLGVAFRRQYVVGGRIVDFVAPSIRLVVEVDGGSHAGREAADARRERELERLGYCVVRVQAREVMRDLAGVVRRFREAVERRRAERDGAPPP